LSLFAVKNLIFCNLVKPTCI